MIWEVCPWFVLSFFLDKTMAPPPPPPGLVLRMDYSSPILNSQQQSVVGVTNASKMRS